MIKIEYVLATLFALWLFGCDEKPPPRQDTVEKPKVEKPVDQTPVDKAKVAAASAIEKALLAKTNGSSELDQLKADKDALVKQRDLARAERDAAATKASDLDKNIKDKNDQIAEARDRATQERIYWFAGILGFVALVGGVVAFAFPLVRSWAGGLALACGAMAAVAVFCAWLVPYVWWIGAFLVAAAVLGALVAWAKDVKVGGAVIGAVEKFKHEIPNYKEKMREELASVDTAIDRRREQMGLKQKVKKG